MRHLALCFVMALSQATFAFSDAVVLRAKSDDVVLALREKNFWVLRAHMGSKKLRFAPYVHLVSTDRQLTKTAVSGFFSDTTTYNWGTEDGSGFSILLKNNAYYNRYIHRADYFTSTTVSFNSRVAVGNLNSNFASVYPGRAFYEYYMPASTTGGLDWMALDVIWQKDSSGLWKLVAIVNDEWTI